MFAGEGDRVAAGVQLWRDDLNKALAAHLAAPLAWDEEQEGEWSCELPESAHRALQLLAAYAQCSDLSWPDEVPPGVDTDAAWQEISAGDFARCQYPQVVIPRFWVPGDFAFTVKHVLPDGEEVVLGSLDGLRQQLRVLNRNTLQMEADAMATQLTSPPASGAGFPTEAAYTLALFHRASDEADGLAVPVRLLQTA